MFTFYIKLDIWWNVWIDTADIFNVCLFMPFYLLKAYRPLTKNKAWPSFLNV